MSDEERAVVYELIDELLREFDKVSRDWLEGYITTGEAVSDQQEIRAKIRELRYELEDVRPRST